MILLVVFIIILLLRDNIILLVLPSNIQLIGAFNLLKDEAFSCVFLAENGLFDLARGVAGNGCKDDLARTLVSGELKAEGIDFIFGHIFAFLDLDHRKSDLTESLFGDADDGNVLDLCVRAEEIFDLNGINVLAARDDDVLFAVNEPDEAVLVLAGHVARVEPAVLAEYLVGRLRILIVAFHNAGALDGKLADLARKHRAAALVNDPGLPAVARLADRADLVDVFNAKVNASGADRLGKTVVCVIFVVREVLLPTLDEARGDGLRADVHQPPLVELVFIKIDLAAVDGVKNVLRPRNEQPNNGAMLLGDGLDDLFRCGTLEEDCL